MSTYHCELPRIETINLQMAVFEGYIPVNIETDYIYKIRWPYSRVIYQMAVFEGYIPVNIETDYIYKISDV